MRILSVVFALAWSLAICAQPSTAKPESPIAFTPEAVVWNDGPSTMPPGTKMAVLEGNPRAEGMFTMRVRVPGGSAIPPHWHPRHERVTILSGAVDLGFGAVTNAGSVTRYRAGSFYVNPPRVMHYLFFPEATEIQITGVGPWELFTSDITERPGQEATASVTVRSLTPAAGSAVTVSTTVKAIVDYEIRNFRPATYFIDFMFEGTTPDHTVGFGKESKSDSQNVLPPPPEFVTKATGTVTITQELDRALTMPMVKRPLRMRVFVHEQMTTTRNRVVGQSDWIEFH